MSSTISDIYDNISMNYSESEKSFRQNLWRTSKHAIFAEDIPLCLLTIIICFKTSSLYAIFFNQKSCLFFFDNVEKYSRARQATDGDIIRLMRLACWVTKSTNKHSECLILTAFPRQHSLS